MAPALQRIEKEILLEVKNVSLNLGGNLILRDLNAVIKNVLGHGQVVGFLGPSGIGKTQLLRILAGLQEPTTGTVLITEDQKPVKCGDVGVVSQNYELFDHRTVLGNLVVAVRQKGFPKKEARERAMEMLKTFDLADRARYYPAQLSGGQKQRAAIAQQLLCSEHFLLMDEPFSGLDPKNANRACEWIQKVASADELNTIIIVTHDIPAAVSVSDTLWLMGRDYDADGNVIPGAYLKEEIDLVKKGLAWHSEITKTAQFSDFVREIRARFDSL